MTLAILFGGRARNARHVRPDRRRAAGGALFTRRPAPRRRSARVGSAGRAGRAARNRAAQILCTVGARRRRCSAVWPRRRCVAGYSVGEVASWSVAGMIEPDAALDLADARARDGCRERRRRADGVRTRPDACQLARLCDSRDAAIAIANPGATRSWSRGGEPDVDAVADDASRAGALRVAPSACGSRRTRAGSPRPCGCFARRSPRRRTAAAARHAAVFGDRWRIGAGRRRRPRQACAAGRGAGRVGGLSGRVRGAGATAFLELGYSRALAEMAGGAYPALPAQPRGFPLRRRRGELALTRRGGLIGRMKNAR